MGSPARLRSSAIYPGESSVASASSKSWIVSALNPGTRASARICFGVIKCRSKKNSASSTVVADISGKNDQGSTLRYTGAGSGDSARTKVPEDGPSSATPQAALRLSDTIGPLRTPVPMIHPSSITRRADALKRDSLNWSSISRSIKTAAAFAESVSG